MNRLQIGRLVSGHTEWWLVSVWGAVSPSVGCTAAVCVLEFSAGCLGFSSGNAFHGSTGLK